MGLLFKHRDTPPEMKVIVDIWLMRITLDGKINDNPVSKLLADEHSL